MTSSRGPIVTARSRSAFLMASTAILLLAGILRLVALHDVPPGLAQDEVLNADIVTFILQGKHALFFREGYGHEPLYHYWSVPFRLLLGDNVLSIRLPSVFLGLLLISATLRWARRDFGTVAALAAGTGLAIAWWPIVFSRVGLRPILEPLLLVVAAWYWPRRPRLAGLFLGLSIYSYTAARYVFLLPLLFAGGLLLIQSRKDTGWGRPRTALVVFAVALACYLPLAFVLRSDPTLQQRVTQLAGPLQSLREGDIGPIWETSRATLGVFSVSGDPRWTYTIASRPLYDPFTALFFYAGLLLALLRWRRPRYLFLLVWLLFGLLPSAATPQAPSTVRLVGAMPLVYLFPALAISWLSQHVGNRRRLKSPLTALLILLFILNLGRSVQDGFVRWPRAVETRLKYQTVLLDIAHYWEQESTGVPVVADAYFEPIDADTFRRNLGRPVPARWIQTGNEVDGALVWPGSIAALFIPEFAPPHTLLMEMAGVDKQPRYRSLSQPGFAYYELPSTAPQPEHPLNATFDERLTLLGYTLMPPARGEPVHLFTYWQVRAPLPADLAIFVHAVDDSAAVIAQHDALDAAPAYLQLGDVVVQHHRLTLPDGGVYTLQLGLYLRGNGARLQHEGQPSDLIHIPEPIQVGR